MSRHELFGGLALIGMLGLAGLFVLPWFGCLLVWSGIAKWCPPIVSTITEPLWLAVSLVSGAALWGISRLLANQNLS